MGQAQQLPFGLHLLQSAQQKLAETARLFDLAEDGLHKVFPFGIPLSARRRAEFMGHALLGC